MVVVCEEGRVRGVRDEVDDELLLLLSTMLATTVGSSLLDELVVGAADDAATSPSSQVIAPFSHLVPLRSREKTGKSVSVLQVRLRCKERDVRSDATHVGTVFPVAQRPQVGSNALDRCFGARPPLLTTRQATMRAMRELLVVSAYEVASDGVSDLGR